MVAADRQVFQGRGAIVRRLNAGVETLAKMAGGGGDSGGGEAEQQQQPWQQQQQLLAFELEGPSPGPGGTVVVRLAEGLLLRARLQRSRALTGRRRAEAPDTS